MDTEQGFKEFIAEMKLKLDMNQAKKGDSWVTCDIEFLQGKLREEMKEYYDAEGSMIGARELVDIANVCMMLFHRYREEWAKRGSAEVIWRCNGKVNERLKIRLAINKNGEHYFKSLWNINKDLGNIAGTFMELNEEYVLNHNDEEQTFKTLDILRTGFTDNQRRFLERLKNNLIGGKPPK